MNQGGDDDSTRYEVVINDEEQYSVWPIGAERLLGWRAVGKEGTKAECLRYIGEVWIDMRPLSVRRQLRDRSLQAGP